MKTIQKVTLTISVLALIVSGITMLLLLGR